MTAEQKLVEKLFSVGERLPRLVSMLDACPPALDQKERLAGQDLIELCEAKKYKQCHLRAAEEVGRSA